MLYGFGALVLGTIVSSSFGEEYAEKGMGLWFLYLGLYLPVYVLHANEVGTIVGAYMQVEKSKNPTGFRGVQILYLVFSLVLVIGYLGSVT